MIINFDRIGQGGGGSGSGSTVSVNQILSAGTEIAQISVDGQNTSLYAPEAGGEGITAYYFNEMTQTELAALYAELNVYRNSDDTPNVDEEKGYPAGKYRFFYYNGDNDEFKGYYELLLARFDGMGPIDFSANFQSRYNSKIFQKGLRLYADGTLEERFSNSANLTPYELPAATDQVLGGVKIGSGITVDSGGTISVEGGQGGTSKSYVLNEMTQQERKDLYDELVVWRNDNTGGILSGFPAGDYSFFVNVDFGDEYRGIIPLSISFMHPSDYGGAIFFDGVVGDRRNYPISYIERYVIISDGSVDTNRLAVGGHQFSTFNYSWIGRMSYDADNSVFKRGDTTLAADTSYDSFEASNTIDYMIDKGGREDDYPAFSLYMPIFPIYVISGGTEQKYTSPKIIGKNISSTTVDGQTYTRQYFYIYDKEDGSRFIISCLLNNNNNAANFTYTAV